MGTPLCCLFLLLAAPEHEPGYFYPNAEGEKYRPEPDIIRREKH
jgi:hypothetical protein